MLRISRVLLLVLPILFASSASANTHQKYINGYINLHKKQFKATCSNRIDNETSKLYKSYLGDGIFIPFKNSGELDDITISEYIPLMEQKKKWLDQTVEKLSKVKSFRSLITKNKSVQRSFEKALSHTYKYVYVKDLKEKSQIARQSKNDIKNFLKLLEKHLNELYFFHSFKFPVDHLHLRSEYDRLKGIDTDEGKIKSNSAYLIRKIIEDGSVDSKKGRSDLSLRSLIDTVYLRIIGYEKTFLDEDLRYDIKDLLARLDGVLRKGQRYTFNRTKYWRKKVSERNTYYSNLLTKSKSKDQLLTKIYKDKNQARYALKDYIYSKEAEVYKFWMNQKEIYRKLFTLETILIHEVGRLDNSYGSERRDVAKVVLNRVDNPLYNTIESDEPFYDYLKKAGVKNTEQYPWLNVLFKRGQFSFTYFFIPASKGIFCPDQSRTAKRLKKKNLAIILNELTNTDKEFDATRYFSRASMLGRIDMSSLWNDYNPVSESPGPMILNDKKLKSLYKRKNLNYLYSFEVQGGKSYDVLRYKNRYYVHSQIENRFYQYRNPHYFKYFSKKKNY